MTTTNEVVCQNPTVTETGKHWPEGMIPPPPQGRVTVERWMWVRATRDEGNGRASGGMSERRVGIIAERTADHTRVLFEVMPDTTVETDLDTLVEVVTALCPPWLLRKKLGM